MNKSLRIDVSMRYRFIWEMTPLSRGLKTTLVKKAMARRTGRNSPLHSWSAVWWGVERANYELAFRACRMDRHSSHKSVLAALLIAVIDCWAILSPAVTPSLTSGDISSRNCQSGLNWLFFKFAPAIDHNGEKIHASELFRMKIYTERNR